MVILIRKTDKPFLKIKSNPVIYEYIKLTTLKQFCRDKHILLESDYLGKNVAKVNTKKNILPLQKPQQLLTAEMNFAG